MYKTLWNLDVLRGEWVETEEFKNHKVKETPFKELVQEYVSRDFKFSPDLLSESIMSPYNPRTRWQGDWKKMEKRGEQEIWKSRWKTEFSEEDCVHYAESLDKHKKIIFGDYSILEWNPIIHSLWANISCRNFQNVIEVAEEILWIIKYFQSIRSVKIPFDVCQDLNFTETENQIRLNRYILAIEMVLANAYKHLGNHPMSIEYFIRCLQHQIREEQSINRQMECAIEIHKLNHKKGYSISRPEYNFKVVGKSLKNLKEFMKLRNQYAKNAPSMDMLTEIFLVDYMYEKEVKGLKI